MSEAYATDASTGALTWQVVDERARTASMAENTLNTKLDIDHTFRIRSGQLVSRLVQTGICRMYAMSRLQAD
jgi:hypothetical protein